MRLPNFIPAEVILLQIECINWTAAINLGIYFMLIFVSYKKGHPLWKKVAPWLYLSLNLIGFILIPVINISFTMYTITVVEVDDDETYLLIWIWFYTMFSIC